MKAQSIVDGLVGLGLLVAVCLLFATVAASARSTADRRAVPDAGVPLGAVWTTGEVTTALPERGELLFFDRHGRTRAKILDGTWPLRLRVFPIRGGPVMIEVDELGRANITPEVP